MYPELFFMTVQIKPITFYKNRLNYVLAVHIIVVNVCVSFSQTELGYHQLWNNYSLINPAATGIFGKNYLSISRRSENTYINKNPKAFSFILDHRFLKRDCGVGISFKNDKYGYLNSNKFNINGSYQFRIAENGKLSLGASLNTTGFHYLPDYLVSLIVKEQNGRLYDVNLGMMIKTKRFVFGLSTVNVAHSKYRRDSYIYQNQRYTFANITYDFDIGKSLTVRPGVFLKTDFNFTAIDYNILLRIKEEYRIGFSYREKDKISFIAGLDLGSKIRLGYSYSTTTSKKNNDLIGGSHELGIVFLFN